MKTLLAVLSASVALVVFQNCSGGFEAKSSPTSELNSVDSGSQAPASSTAPNVLQNVTPAAVGSTAAALVIPPNALTRFEGTIVPAGLPGGDVLKNARCPAGLRQERSEVAIPNWDVNYFVLSHPCYQYYGAGGSAQVVSDIKIMPAGQACAAPFVKTGLIRNSIDANWALRPTIHQEICALYQPTALATQVVTNFALSLGNCVAGDIQVGTHASMTMTKNVVYCARKRSTLKAENGIVTIRNANRSLVPNPFTEAVNEYAAFNAGSVVITEVKTVALNAACPAGMTEEAATFMNALKVCARRANYAQAARALSRLTVVNTGWIAALSGIGETCPEGDEQIGVYQAPGGKTGAPPPIYLCVSY